MSTTEAPPTTFDQNCLTVLECYAVRDAAAKVSHSDYSGWLGLETSSLTSIHGFLIAQGLIKFEFTGRSVGLQYQLSTLGRESIARKSLFLSDDLRNAEAQGEYVADGKTQAA
jgi:hypothetical protein